MEHAHYRDLLVHTVVLVVLLLVANGAGVLYNLYSIFPWYDVFTHMWGGLVIGFFIQAILVRFTKLEPAMRRYQYVWLAVIFSIAIGWEFYEILVNALFPHYPFRFIDTLWDIVNDLVGAWIAYLWSARYIHPRYYK